MERVPDTDSDSLPCEWCHKERKTFLMFFDDGTGKDRRYERVCEECYKNQADMPGGA